MQLLGDKLKPTDGTVWDLWRLILRKWTYLSIRFSPILQKSNSFRKDRGFRLFVFLETVTRRREEYVALVKQYRMLRDIPLQNTISKFSPCLVQNVYLRYKNQ